MAVVQRAEAALLVEGVDLDHDPVDLVVELDAPLLPFAAGRGDRLDRVVTLRVGVRAEAVLAQPLQRLPVTARGKALALTETVDPDRQRPLGGDRTSPSGRSDPAAALRGFGVGFLPSATSRSLSSLKPLSGR